MALPYGQKVEIVITAAGDRELVDLIAVPGYNYYCIGCTGEDPNDLRMPRFAWSTQRRRLYTKALVLQRTSPHQLPQYSYIRQDTQTLSIVRVVSVCGSCMRRFPDS